MPDQMNFSDAEQDTKLKKMRREVFIDEMEKVVPWAALAAVIESNYPRAGKGRHRYPLSKMLRIHLMQQWYALSGPAMAESLYEIASIRRFDRLSLARSTIPAEATTLNFRHLLEKQSLAERILETMNKLLVRKGLMLKQGTIVEATLIAAPSSTKNDSGTHDPEMHQTRKEKQCYFGMRAHVGSDAATGLAHAFEGAAANMADVTVASDLRHGKEEIVFADAGYQGGKAYREHGEERGVARGHASGQAQGAERVETYADPGPDRPDQGAGAGEGRARLPRGEAAVRLHQRALPRAGEEHRAVAYAVRAGEPVDGATGVDEYAITPSARYGIPRKPGTGKSGPRACERYRANQLTRPMRNSSDINFTHTCLPINRVLEYTCTHHHRYHSKPSYICCNWEMICSKKKLQKFPSMT